MARPRISIIIVHWNTPDLLKGCLGSIQRYESGIKPEIMIVDNASQNLSPTILKSFPDVRLVRLKKNIGFGRACNLGARLAQGEVLLFLGPDVRFIEDGTIARTLEQYDSRPEAGAMSCLLLNEDGSPQKHYFNLPSPGRLIEEWFQETTNHIPWLHRLRRARPQPRLQKVDMVIAHWLMVAKRKFIEADGFPEDAFMFGDDIEINHRLLKQGYRNYLYRGARAIHLGGASTKKFYGDGLTYVVQDSITRFCLRHYGVVGGTLSISIIFLRAIFGALFLSPLHLGRDFKEYFGSHWRIIWHYLAYQWQPERIRRIAFGGYRLRT